MLAHARRGRKSPGEIAGRQDPSATGYRERSLAVTLGVGNQSQEGLSLSVSPRRDGARNRPDDRNFSAMHHKNTYWSQIDME